MSARPPFASSFIFSQEHSSDFESTGAISLEAMVGRRQLRGVGPLGSVYGGQLEGEDVYGEEGDDGFVLYPVAMKQLSVLNLPDHILIPFKDRTRQIKNMPSHPHLVGFIGVCFGNEKRYTNLVTELMAQSLDDLFNKKTDIPLPTILQIAADISSGLSYLHSQNIIHGSLGPRNILLTDDLRAKISDYGFRELKLQLQKLMLEQGGSIKAGTELPNTRKYEAPELFVLHPKNTPQSDVYSLGMILLELVTGKKPYAGLSKDQITNAIKNGIPDLMLSDCPEPLVQIITACLSFDPTKRPTSAELSQRLAALAAAPSPALGLSSANRDVSISIVQPLSDETFPISPKENASVSDGGISSTALKYNEKQPLGFGPLGKVYAGKLHGADGEHDVAIKHLHNQHLDETLEEFKRKTREISNMPSHPHLVKLIGACFDQWHYGFVTELMSQSLEDLSNKKTNIPVPTMLQIAADISSGLSYLHSQNMIHENLTSRDVLLDKALRAKISDYGFNKLRRLLLAEPTYGGSIGDLKMPSTIEYKAPELFKPHSSNTPQSDVYSLGVILWELVAGKKPYAGLSIDQITDAIKEGRHDPIPPDCPKALAQIIMECWDLDPKKRPTSAELSQRLAALVVAASSTTDLSAKPSASPFGTAPQILMSAPKPNSTQAQPGDKPVPVTPVGATPGARNV